MTIIRTAKFVVKEVIFFSVTIVISPSTHLALFLHYCLFLRYINVCNFNFVGKLGVS